MGSLREPALFAALAPARRVLVAGAGGGFDVYAGLPLAFALAAAGKTVHLANLSFSQLWGAPLEDRLTPAVVAVDPDTPGPDDYFPERTLARWLDEHDRPSTVYAFELVGVVPLREAYAKLVETLDIDAIVLVDGGTDILMRGDEAGLGTPGEDMSSLAAVAGLTGVAIRLVVCVGLGIDAYHGVTNVDTLENIATLNRDGAYLGALSIPRDSEEGAAYLDAVADAMAVTRTRPSIVNGQVAAAIRGEFGDVRFTSRTAGGELFVNPMMAIYLTFDLMGLYRRLDYRMALEGTQTPRQVAAAIERHRAEITPRPRRRVPH
jgi:hypothetical protein